MTVRYSWTQPQCGMCFRKDNPGREPYRLKLPEPERCCTCGTDTTDGIYIRIDPAVARWPTKEK